MHSETESSGRTRRESVGWAAAWLAIAAVLAFSYALEGGFDDPAERLGRAIGSVLVGAALVAAGWGLLRLFHVTAKPFFSPTVLLVAAFVGAWTALAADRGRTEETVDAAVDMIQETSQACRADTGRPLPDRAGDIRLREFSEKERAALGEAFADAALPTDAAELFYGYDIEQRRRFLGTAFALATTGQEQRDGIVDGVGAQLGATATSTVVAGVGSATVLTTPQETLVAASKRCYLVMISARDQSSAEFLAARLLRE